MPQRLAAAVGPLARISAMDVLPLMRGLTEWAALQTGVASALVAQGVNPIVAYQTARIWETLGIIQPTSIEMAAVRPLIAQTAGLAGITGMMPGVLGAQKFPGVLGAPKFPGVLGAPKFPGVLGAQKFPGVLGAPKFPGVLGAPKFPGVLGAPKFPGVLGAPKFPGVLGMPQIPGILGAPGLGALGAVTLC